MLLLSQVTLGLMHNHHTSAINESTLFSSTERPSKQAMYQSSFIFFFASQRIVKHRSALARPTNTTAICNTGNTSGTWGRLIDWLTEGPRNRETGLANLRNIGGPVFVAALALAEQVLWQTWKTIADRGTVMVSSLDVSTVWRPAFASWLERVRRHGGLFSSLLSLTLS